MVKGDPVKFSQLSLRTPAPLGSQYPHHLGISPCPIPLVLSNRLEGLLWLAPVALHDAVPSDIQLPGHVQVGQLPRLRVHNLGLGWESFHLEPPAFLLWGIGSLETGLGGNRGLFFLPFTLSEMKLLALLIAVQGKEREAQIDPLP